MAGTDIARSDYARRGTWDHRTLVRELASGDFTRAELGKKYGISGQAVTQFAQRHAAEIDAVSGQMEAAFTGLWIADKASRIIAHQRDYEAALASDKADHHEWIKARTAILHAVAEELGQLPPRATIAVVPVQHVIIGIDPEVLK